MYIKYCSYQLAQIAYKCENLQLLSAMSGRLTLSSGPLPQDLTHEGVDDEEWVGVWLQTLNHYFLHFFSFFLHFTVVFACL